MKTIKISILLLLFASCSPEQRIARILRNHPSLVKTDTIWKKDTIFTKSVEKDTTFYFNQPDTVYMNEGKMHVKYYFNRDSTVYLQGKCDADTVIKYYPIQINSVSVKNQTLLDKVKLWIIDNILWIALVLFVLWRIFGKAIRTFLHL